MFGKKKKFSSEDSEENKSVEVTEESKSEELTKEDSKTESEEDKQSSTENASDDDFSVDIGLMKESDFGPLKDLVNNKDVTDINWNGRHLWVDDLSKGRYKSDEILTPEFVTDFSVKVSNVVSQKFNKYTPKLEAETEDLRISILHESVAHTGRSISIRKTPAIKRIVFKDSISNGSYCPVEVANFLSNAVKSKCNIVVCGLPGVGKTELVKYLTGYIFPQDRVITIEDNLELHYSDINPDKDCIEIKVDDKFTYVDAIKASLRQLPVWIMLSEARSTEVKYLLEALSTGTHCLTTIHTDDVRKLADRIKNMIGDSIMADRIENEVYSFIDVAILINKRTTSDGKIERFIEQVGTFDRDGKDNSCNLIYDDGNLNKDKLQKAIAHKMAVTGIEDPFKYTFIRG